MKALLIAALLAAPTDDRPRGGGLHVPTLALHLNDDLEASFGGTSAASYYAWAYDSASTRFELRSTDCDGGGSDCVPLYIVDGTDDVVLSGKLSLDGGVLVLDKDEPTTYIVRYAANQIGFYTAGALALRINSSKKAFFEGDMQVGTLGILSWNGRTRISMPDNGDILIDNALGTQGFKLVSSAVDGELLFTDEAGGSLTLRVTPYTRHIDRPIMAATVGATAPTAVTIGTRRCLQFTQAITAETAHIEFAIPEDWIGTADLTLRFYWYPEAGDAVADTETVQWDATYRSTTYTSTGGEAYDNGTAVTISATHTQSGAGTDKAGYVTTATMAYTGGNQPLTKGDRVGVAIDLNEGATSYSGDPILCVVDATLQSNTFPAE